MIRIMLRLSYKGILWKVFPQFFPEEMIPQQIIPW